MSVVQDTNNATTNAVDEQQRRELNTTSQTNGHNADVADMNNDANQEVCVWALKILWFSS